MTMVSRRARLSVAGIALALAALIVTFQWIQASHTRVTALGHAARETQLLAHMLAEHSQYAIHLADLALDDAVRDQENLAAPDTLFSAEFRRLTTPLSVIRNVMVLNRDGRVLRALRTDQNRTEEALALQAPLRSGPTDDIVGVPAQGGLAPGIMIRRSLGPAGVVATVLDTDSLTSCCALTSPEAAAGDSVVGSIVLSLASADGTDLIQSDGQRPGSSAETRLVSITRIGDLPILAVAAIDRDVALAGWRLDTTVGAIRTVLLVLIIGTLAVLGLRLMSRQDAYQRNLGEQAALLRATVDGVSHGISVFDREGRLVLWNRRFIELQTIPEPLATVGTPFAAIADHFAAPGENQSDTADALAPPAGQAVRERTLASGVVVELRDTTLPDGSFITTTTDVTEHRRAEIALRTTAERFRLLFDGTPAIAVQGYDGNRRVVFWNAASEALYDYRRDQALGCRLEDLIAPSSQYAKVVRELTDWRDADTTPVSGERIRRRRDGTPVPVYTSHARLTTPDGHQEFYCIDIDLTEIKRTQDALRASEGRFRDYADAASDWFWEMAPDLRITSVSNDRTKTGSLDRHDLLGLTRPEDTGNPADTPFWRSHRELLDRRLPFRDFIYPVTANTAAADTGNDTGHARVRYIRASGKPAFDEDGVFLGYRGTASDVTAQVRAGETLHKLSEAVAQCPAAIAIVDAHGLIEYVNRRFSENTGYHPDEVENQSLSILNPEADTRPEAWQPPGGGRAWRGEWHKRRKDGSLYWELATVTPITATDGRVSHFLVIGEDLSERKIFEKQLLHQAHYDALTGLPNRLLLFDRLTQALAAGRREHRVLALLFVDLDHFKVINEVLGHDGGDRLLIEAARRLVEVVSDGDTVARFGSDEFVIILPDLTACVYADAVAHRILAAFSRPFTVSGREFTVTASVGITVAPADGDAPQSLLRNADAAMRQAKAVGRNSYRFFTPEINRKVGERLTLESHLRYAVARNELSLVYQPITDLRTGASIGAEALLRWSNPDLGQVPPDHFIPVAEDTGLIIEIGEWVLHQACQEAGGWAALAGRPISLAVNISACQFRRLELIRTVTEALAAGGLSATALELEITERLLVESASANMVILEELHEMGIRISIDDFGTGYSSLSYLKHLPVQTLKIDRSFVKDVPTGPRDSALTAAIVALAHNLDLQVIGEGVETQAQLDFLRSQGCDYIQGYLISRPLPAPAFRAFLQRT